MAEQRADADEVDSGVRPVRAEAMAQQLAAADLQMPAASQARWKQRWPLARSNGRNGFERAGINQSATGHVVVAPASSACGCASTSGEVAAPAARYWMVWM